MDRQTELKKIHGNWEGSYNELPRWLAAFYLFCPDFVSFLETQLGVDSDGRPIGIFQRVFWTFRSFVEAFAHCKPLLQINGTHLYGKYKGSLLMAIAQEGSNKILLVAFAIVEGETEEAWQFFLKNLRLYVAPYEGLSLISGRHASIIATVEHLGDMFRPPSLHHVYCIRHVAVNFLKRFKQKGMTENLVNAAYAKTLFGFNYYYNKVAADPQCKSWIDRIPREKWSQYYDGGRRWGQMTTNLVEAVNAVLKDTENLPITAIVQKTYYRLNELFLEQTKKTISQSRLGRIFSEYLYNTIEDLRLAKGSHFVRSFSRDNNQAIVEEQMGQRQGGSITPYRVNLYDRTCDCGEFQVNRFPCRHALALCAYAGFDWQLFVNNIYKLEAVQSVYRTGFEMVGHPDFWPPYSGIPIYPNPLLRRDLKGRPRSSRLRNEMDIREKGRPKRCAYYRVEGHSRTTCSNRGDSSQQ